MGTLMIPGKTEFALVMKVMKMLEFPQPGKI